MSRTSQAWWYMPLIPAMLEGKVGRSLSEVSPGQKVQDLIWKKKKKTLSEK
jgi:hypothetical protein